MTYDRVFPLPVVPISSVLLFSLVSNESFETLTPSASMRRDRSRRMSIPPRNDPVRQTEVNGFPGTEIRVLRGLRQYLLD